MDPQEAAKRNLERLRFAHERVLAMINATANFEREAIRPPFYLNGGALVVYMALYGATSTAQYGTKLDKTWALWAIGVWACGIVMASLAAGFGFYSQWALRRHRGDEVERDAAREVGDMERAGVHAERADVAGGAGGRHRRRAVWAVAISLLAFIGGAVLAMLSLLYAR
jgi:hypothetical protein